MTRNKGFSKFAGSLTRTSRQLERAARLSSQQIRDIKNLTKEQKLRYFDAREEEAESLNAALEDEISALALILERGIETAEPVAFNQLRQKDAYPDFVPPIFNEVQPTAPLFKIWPGAMQKYERKVIEWQNKKNKFFADVELAKAQHESERLEFLSKVREYNREVEEFKKSYFELDSEAIEAYYELVLERSCSEYPANFPRAFRVALVSESHHLVVEVELPLVDVIPKEEQFRFIKSRDEITSKPRKAKDIKDLYSDIVAGIALRTIYEVFVADQIDAIQVVSFNGYVNARDPATGRKVKPVLISLTATKASFQEIDLEHINKAVCLRNLGANVSGKPEEMHAVKPVVEFNMVDRRFIDQTDLLGELDSQTNLMDLTPSAFETLVSNLFQEMGLEAKLTRTSKDGGVDCVAFDNRPVLGGKVVIQAKRYRHTVGVSAVRDLFGTMQHEGANKGILVTTSGYGPDAFEFAKDKPIELITGSQLLYLLKDIGMDARIIFPQDAT